MSWEEMVDLLDSKTKESTILVKVKRKRKTARLFDKPLLHYDSSGIYETWRKDRMAGYV